MIGMLSAERNEAELLFAAEAGPFVQVADHVGGGGAAAAVAHHQDRPLIVISLAEDLGHGGDLARIDLRNRVLELGQILADWRR